MTKPLAVLVVAALASACGGGDCKQRSGSYTASLRARSGNCGASMETVVVMPSQPTALPSGCTGSVTASADNCEVTMDTTCPSDQGSTVKMAGKSDWSTDGASGTAVVAMELRTSTGALACQGSYDVTYTKL